LTRSLRCIIDLLPKWSSSSMSSSCCSGTAFHASFLARLAPFLAASMRTRRDPARAIIVLLGYALAQSMSLAPTAATAAALAIAGNADRAMPIPGPA
jgi:hypothetical protein